MTGPQKPVTVHVYDTGPDLFRMILGTRYQATTRGPLGNRIVLAYGYTARHASTALNREHPVLTITIPEPEQK